MSLIEEAEKLNWFHCIDFGNGYITKGSVDHCTEELATNRFGIPEDLKEKTVLDVGANNGYFSFLAERRGAKVTAIEPNQGDGDNIKCLLMAAELLESNANLYMMDLGGFYNNFKNQFDIVFYFGVLYHIENPLQELRRLFNIAKEYVLIETAIALTDYGDKSVWEFNNGFDGDKTNFWYCSLAGLESALKYVGFKKMELIYRFHDVRVTVKAYK